MVVGGKEDNFGAEVLRLLSSLSKGPAAYMDIACKGKSPFPQLLATAASDEIDPAGQVDRFGFSALSE